MERIKQFLVKLAKFTSSHITTASSILYTVIGAIFSTILAVYFVEDNKITNVHLLEFILLIWVISGICYLFIDFIIINPKNKEIEDLKRTVEINKEIIGEQKRFLEGNMSVIEGKYGEFSRYINKDKHIDFIKKVTEHFGYLEAIQVHSWSCRVSNNSVIYKISNDYSYTKENININTIDQQYYTIDKEVFEKFDTIVNIYINNSKDMNEVICNLIIDESLKILRLISQDNRIEHLRIAEIILDILEDIVDEDKMEEILKEIDEEKNENILDKYRTGILGTILTGIDYKYDYGKENDTKISRTYFTFTDKYDNDNKVITCVMNKNVKRSDEVILNEMVSYYEDLYKKYNI